MNAGVRELVCSCSVFKTSLRLFIPLTVVCFSCNEKALQPSHGWPRKSLQVQKDILRVEDVEVTEENADLYN
uniref:Uncharacterized protein n=1 Tax=Trichobilharzia regenti TaxID=157069 RepID=A0AA85KJN7_TRIRE|nr:unnamed protein product [Trichobilharzia regenti]